MQFGYMDPRVRDLSGFTVEFRGFRLPSGLDVLLFS